MGCATSVPVDPPLVVVQKLKEVSAAERTSETSVAHEQHDKSSSSTATATSSSEEESLFQHNNNKEEEEDDDHDEACGAGGPPPRDCWADMLGMEHCDAGQEHSSFRRAVDGEDFVNDVMIAAEHDRHELEESSRMSTEQMVDMLVSNWAEFVQEATSETTTAEGTAPSARASSLAMEYWTLEGLALDVLVNQWDRICEKAWQRDKNSSCHPIITISEVSMYQTVIGNDTDGRAAKQVLQFLTKTLGPGVLQKLSIQQPRQPSQLSGELAFSIFDSSTLGDEGPQPCALLQHSCLAGELHCIRELHLEQVDLRGCGAGLEALLSHESCRVEQLSLHHVLMDDEVVQAFLGRGLARHSSGSLQRLVLEGMADAPHLRRIHRLEQERDERGRLFGGLNNEHLECLVDSVIQSPTLGKTLQGLGLPGHSALTGATCLSSLARLLEHCPNLQALVLQQCDCLFQGHDDDDSSSSTQEAFCRAISKATSLHTLDLSCTGLLSLDDNDGAAATPDVMMLAKPLMEALTVPNRIETLNLLQQQETKEEEWPQHSQEEEGRGSDNNPISKAVLECLPRLTKLRVLGAPLPLDSPETMAVLQANTTLTELHVASSNNSNDSVLGNGGGLLQERRLLQEYNHILKRNQIHHVVARIAGAADADGDWNRRGVPLALWPHCLQQQQEENGGGDGGTTRTQVSAATPPRQGSPSVTFALLRNHGNQMMNE